jgi:hypothetical protein
MRYVIQKAVNFVKRCACTHSVTAGEFENGFCLPIKNLKENGIFPAEFNRSLQYEVSRKPVQWEPS